MTTPAEAIFERIGSLKEGGMWTLDAFFAAWTEMGAIIDADRSEGYLTDVMNDEVPSEWLRALDDGRYAAWLAANPVRKAG